MSSAGVLGAGSIGKRHAAVMASLGWEVLLAPANGTSGRTAEPGSQLVDPDELRAVAPSLDVVVVATDTIRHVADAVSLAKSGASRILVEKPLGCNLTDIGPLLDIGDSADIAVAAPLRATDAYAALSQLVEQADETFHSGVALCQSWLPSWRPDRDYRDSYSADPAQGGVLRDMVHEIDYVINLLGQSKLIGAEVSTAGPLDIDSDQQAALLASFGSTTLSIHLDYTSRVPRREFALSGAHQHVVWKLLEQSISVTNANGETTTTEFPDDKDRNKAMARQVSSFVSPNPESRYAQPTSLVSAAECLKLCDLARSFIA